MSTIRKYYFILGLGLCMLNAGCFKENGNTPDETVTLGAVYNLTGDQSSLDIPSARGAQLAVERINSAGGVNGRRIRLMIRDGQSNPDVLESVIPEILTAYPETAAFLGLSDTDKVLAVAGKAADRERVFLTSGATSPKLPSQIPDFLFLACFGDNVQAAAAAEWAYDELSARTVAVLYDSTDTYTRLLQGYFVSRFTALGGQVVDDQAYAQGQLGPAISKIPAADMVFFSALPSDAPLGVRLMREIGITTPILGGDAYDEPANWEAETTIRGVYFTTHAYLGADNPDTRVQDFRQFYLDTFQEEPSAFAALGYDAVQLLAEALENQVEDDPANLETTLENTRNFQGVTGLVSYDIHRHIPLKSVTIMEMRYGKQHLVTQLVPRQVPEP